MPGIKIDQRKIVRRIHTLREVYEALVEELFGDGYTFLELRILRNTMECYFYDIERTKAFHEIKFIDQHKKSAYTMKWISRLRPIQLVKGKIPNKNHLLANEIYAIYAGLNFMETKTTDISEKYYNNLLYMLRHRLFDGLTLSSHMYLLECCVNKKTP